MRISWLLVPPACSRPGPVENWLGELWAEFRQTKEHIGFWDLMDYCDCERDHVPFGMLLLSPACSSPKRLTAGESGDRDCDSRP